MDSDSDMKEEEPPGVVLSDILIIKMDSIRDGNEIDGIDAAVNSARIEALQNLSFFIVVQIILTFKFREYFDFPFLVKYGYWVKNYMADMISKYGNWSYKPGDSILSGHGSIIMDVCTSFNKKYLYTADICGDILIWKLVTNIQCNRIKVSSKCINCIGCAYGMLFAGDDDGIIHVYNSLTYQAICKLNNHKSIKQIKSIQKENKIIIIINCGNSVDLWDLYSERKIFSLSTKLFKRGSIHILPSIDSFMLSTSVNNWLLDYKLDTVKAEKIAQTVRIRDISLNSGQELAAVCSDTQIVIYHWADLAMIRSFAVNACNCRFHPKHPTMLAFYNYYTPSVQIMDVSNGNLVFQTTQHSDTITGFKFTTDGDRLITHARDKLIVLSDLESFL